MSILNWEACFICQSEENNSPTVSPFKSPKYDSDRKKSSYYKVAENLQNLYEYSDLLPTVLRMQLENYKTVQGLVSQFVKQKAVFHKTCMNKYDGHNFKQKVKTKIINTSSSSPVETPLGEFCSLQIILITVFFFCEKIGDAVNLHQCQTLSLDKRVRKMAQELVDTKFLANLSESDMLSLKPNTIVTVLQDYTMPIVIAAQGDLLKRVLWKSFKVHLIYNPLMNNVSKWSDTL